MNFTNEHTASLIKDSGYKKDSSITNNSLKSPVSQTPSSDLGEIGDWLIVSASYLSVFNLTFHEVDSSQSVSTH